MTAELGSTSQSTGIPPARTIPVTVGTQVFAWVTTSSPGPIPTARRASSTASVPDATPTAWPAAHRRRELLLERPALLAEEEAAAVQHAADRGVQLGANRRTLPPQIDERDLQARQDGLPRARPSVRVG